MFSFQPGKNRAHLGFKEAVLSNFRFLRTYGLKPVEKNHTLVRYESKKVFVSVFHGRGSYEIGVDIGRMDQREKYGLGYIVSWAGEKAVEAEGFGQRTMFQVSNPEGVREIVPRVARLVEKYGSPFLTGGPEFYAELRKANERARVEFQRKQLLAGIRKEADAAWKAKDFARLTELLQPVRDDLTVVEGKRLAYAEKQAAAHKVGRSPSVP